MREHAVFRKHSLDGLVNTRVVRMLNQLVVQCHEEVSIAEFSHCGGKPMMLVYGIELGTHSPGQYTPRSIFLSFDPFMAVAGNQETLKGYWKYGSRAFVTWHVWIFAINALCRFLNDPVPNMLVQHWFDFGHGVAPFGRVETPNVAGNTVALYFLGGGHVR